MVDIVYNAIQRPVANEPDKTDVYHVDRTPRDAGVKKAEDDDPQKQGREGKKRKFAVEKDELNEELAPKKQGKGKYFDENGNQRVDFYV